MAKLKRKSGLLLVLCALALLLTSCGASTSKVLKKVQLGQKYLTQTSYTEAVEAFTEAIKIDADSIQAYMGRAQAYMELAQYEDARDDYSAVLDKAGKPMQQAEAYAGRAEAFRLLGDTDSAKADYDAALSLLSSADIPDSADKSTLLEQVRTGLAALSGEENLTTEVEQNGPGTVSPLPLSTVQSPLADGTYDADFQCSAAVSGSSLNFEVDSCYYYDVAQIESLQPGDTLTGQYDYFGDDAKFTLQIEQVSRLDEFESRWFGGKMQTEYSSEPYDESMVLLKEGDRYFIWLDDFTDRSMLVQKDFRPVGSASEKMADSIVMKITPYGSTQTTVKGIDNVKKVLSANGDSWWMAGGLTVTVKNHQVTEIAYTEHITEEDEFAHSNVVLPELNSSTGAANTTAKTDLASYVGTDLHSFLALHPELKSVGATSGEEYTDGSLDVGADYGGSKIDYVSLNKKCGYSIIGIECGMSAADADKLAEQRYGKAETVESNYHSYVIDENTSTSLSFRISDGKVSRVYILSELNLYE